MRWSIWRSIHEQQCKLLLSPLRIPIIIPCIKFFLRELDDSSHGVCPDYSFLGTPALARVVTSSTSGNWLCRDYMGTMERKNGSYYSRFRGLGFSSDIWFERSVDIETRNTSAFQPRKGHLIGIKRTK